jgi:hypothetical protein
MIYNRYQMKIDIQNYINNCDNINNKKIDIITYLSTSNIINDNINTYNNEYKKLNDYIKNE